MVKTDGEMTLGLVEETVKTFLQANGGNGDALRTPGVSPFGGEHFNGTHDGVQVVKRFALSHEHDVGQRVSLRQGINLIQMSAAERELTKPWRPVMQKAHFILHPT